MGLVALPSAVVSRRAALGWCKRYCRWTLWLLRVLCGTRCEIRGPRAGRALHRRLEAPVLPGRDAADAVAAAAALRHEARAAVGAGLGYFARRIGCVAIDRKAGGEAVRGMVAGIRELAHEGGQVIIFPQGTRVAPGRAGAVSRRGDRSSTRPSACRSRWPRSTPAGSGRAPARGARPARPSSSTWAPIPPGEPPEGLLTRIEAEIEAGSDRLAAEAAAEIRGAAAGAVAPRAASAFASAVPARAPRRRPSGRRHRRASRSREPSAAGPSRRCA